MVKKEVYIMSINEIVGINISVARRNKGLTQRELSEIINVHVNTMNRIETGRKTINVYEIYDLCKALDITPNDLFENL